jgi:hypothetical protein
MDLFQIVEFAAGGLLILIGIVHVSVPARVSAFFDRRNRAKAFQDMRGFSPRIARDSGVLQIMLGCLLVYVGLRG